jgi:hypothetical protein
MFLVVWTTKHGEDQDPWFKDHWVAEESYVDAEKTYEGLLDDAQVYVASICRVEKSTDYSVSGGIPYA